MFLLWLSDIRDLSVLLCIRTEIMAAYFVNQFLNSTTCVISTTLFHVVLTTMVLLQGWYNC